MAQRVQVQLVDDLSGEEAQETVRFGLDGTNYEIDLTEQNAKSLRDALSDLGIAITDTPAGPRWSLAAH